eukprot:TRINITY_DN10061_c0_g1_i3.p2 TRINITY_DN10061_c0_g1~~TRINITY_DN10061_c0_g1_i3.p2  ORF type:complete len:287 (-),score=61.59 TRINITY_DN10061_c0_g1_i3:351-1211(-)
MLQVSRFDPYKGPLEVIAAWVLALQRLPPSIQRTARLVLASSLPGDNPTGAQLGRLCQRFVDSIDVAAMPDTMRGVHDLRRRIHLLLLADARLADHVVRHVGAHTALLAHEAACMREEVMLLGEATPHAAIHHLQTVGFISQSLMEMCLATSPDSFGETVTFTAQQSAAAAEMFRLEGRTLRTCDRAARGCLTGLEMNHLEVNALQSAAAVRLQFSSKEGFALVVSEAMFKLVDGLWGVTVGTDAGGICAQLINHHVGSPVHYSPEEVQASLKMYQNLAAPFFVQG